jgi:hypothetical protein
MKVSTALFASILSICLTAGYVSGQINFADGSVQTTAYEGKSAVQSGDAFSRVFQTVVGTAGTGAPLSPTVPAGKELVILQTNGFGFRNYLHSRLPSPNEATDPIFLAIVGRSSDGDGKTSPTNNYPDGTVIVDEGRQLWGQYEGNNGYVYDCAIYGYYRDKP